MRGLAAQPKATIQVEYIIDSPYFSSPVHTHFVFYSK